VLSPFAVTSGRPRPRSATAAVVVAAVLWAGVFAGRAPAQEMDVPAAIQFPLLLKILQFDQNLAAHAGGEVVIGVVFQGRYRAAFRVKEDIEKAAGEMNRPHILDLPVRVVEIDLERIDLATALDSLHVDVIYVTPLRALDISTISDVTRRYGVTSVTGVEDYVRDGLSVGIGVAQEKPCVVVNLGATRSEGAHFSSRLLSLARLVE